MLGHDFLTEANILKHKIKQKGFCGEIAQG